MRGGCRILLLLAVLVGSVAAAVPSDPRDDKKRVDAELAQTGALLESVSAEVRQAVARLAELNRELPVVRQRAAESRGLVAAAENQVAVNQRKADAARAEWEAASKLYEVAFDKVRDGRERLGRFVAVTHQGGEIAQFNALIGSGGPGELAQRYEYTRQVAMAKKGAVDGLVAALREAKHVSNQATLARNAADTAVALALQAVAEAAAARDAAERAQRELIELTALQAQAAADAESRRAEVLARHEELKRESERIAAELQAWQLTHNPVGPVLRPGARLLMPVRGWKSSNFGMRYDPYYHVWQLHAGVDIAAGGGEPIYASADGHVASAGWRGGYGNYTCLSHGDYEGQRLSTCYAHQSRILVNHGQWVSRGQLIGRVGTTGASTGNHLHFEVRLDGNPVEPENWLPPCLC